MFQLEPSPRSIEESTFLILIENFNIHTLRTMPNFLICQASLWFLLNVNNMDFGDEIYLKDLI
jgi:hypothetical protein